MATRRLSIGPNERVEDVVEAAGIATVTKSIEITFDCAATIVNTTSGTRIMTRDELLHAMIVLEDYIQKMNFPPV